VNLVLESCMFTELVYLSCMQLLGSYVGAVWQTGLLTAAVQKASQQAELLTKYSSASDDASDSGHAARWIVLDGELNPAWIDGVNCLHTEPYSFCALNSEVTTLHGQHRQLLFFLDIYQ